GGILCDHFHCERPRHLATPRSNSLEVSSALSIMDCRVEVIGGVGYLARQYGAFLLVAAR
ncbi:MAG: hypothetical protein ACKVVP_23070, partial [Chloroflexota bacterium]